VDPDDIDAIVEQVSAIYREGELAVLRQVGRHLARYPGAPTASVGAPRLEALGALRRSVEVIQAGLLADGSRAIREGLASAWQLGNRSAVADIPARWFERSGLGQAAEQARALVPQTGAIEALATAIIRDIGNVVRNILRDTLDAYRSAVAGGTARMLAGGQSRREATQAAWAQLVGRGVTGFTDRSGRRWRLHSYAEMAMRTASARAAVTGQDDRLASLGLDLVWISDHVQECELCRSWEGRILHRVSGPTGPVRVEHATEDDVYITIDVAGSVPQARAAGLWHPNCAHSMSAYLPGITRVPRGRPDPKGYEARMRQRAIERKIRRWKDQQAAASTPEAKRAAGKKVRAWQAAMRAHLDAHPDLKRLRYREQPGAGSTPPADENRWGPDPATPLGPDVQPALAGTGGPGGEQVRRPPRVDAQDDAQAPAEVDDRQLSLDDAPVAEEPRELDPADMTGAQLDAELADLMAAGDYDSPRLSALMAEMDARDQAGADPAEVPPAPARTLADMSDAELAEEIGAAYAEEDYDRAAAIEEELQRRDQAAADTPAEPARAPDLDPVWDVPSLSDAELAERLAEAHATGHAHNVAVLEAEAEHRQGVPEAEPLEEMTDAERARYEREEAQHAEIERLATEEGYPWEEAAAEVLGQSVESIRRQEFTRAHRVGDDDRRNFTELARLAYREEVAQWYLQAENATNGYLLTPEGQARGIDPETLFSGPRSRAERWASEELKRWWDANGRTTFEEYVSLIEAGRDTRDPGRDFNR
jgi:hypothetical protein